MKTVFLNLASHSDHPREGACIACVEEGRTAAIRFIDHRIDDAALLPELDAALKEEGWTMQDIGRIACVIGPGGFTSLRMAVTLANVLGDQLQIPLAGVHLSAVYEARSGYWQLAIGNWQQATSHKPQANSQKPSFLWLHSTRSTHLFVRGFGAHAAQWPEATLISIDELTQQLLSLRRNISPPLPLGSVGRERGSGGEDWAGELLPAHREALKDAHLVDAPLRPLEEVLPGFLKGLAYEKQILEPWYGRGW